MSPDVAYERAGGLTPLISRRVGQNHELLGWIAGMGDCISYGVGVRVCVFFLSVLWSSQVRGAPRRHSLRWALPLSSIIKLLVGVYWIFFSSSFLLPRVLQPGVGAPLARWFVCKFDIPPVPYIHTHQVIDSEKKKKLGKEFPKFILSLLLLFIRCSRHPSPLPSYHDYTTDRVFVFVRARPCP